MRRLALLLVLIGAAACSSAEPYRARPGVYDRIPEEWQGDLLGARQALDAEDYRQAHDVVLRLVRKSPWLLPLRVLLQELQLGLLLRGDGSGGFEPVAPRHSGIVAPEDCSQVIATDLDGDGDTDLAIATNDGPMRVFLSTNDAR